MQNKILIFVLVFILGLTTYVLVKPDPKSIEEKSMLENEPLVDHSKSIYSLSKKRNFHSYAGFIDNHQIECVIDFSCQNDSLFGYFTYTYGNNDTFKLRGTCENVNTRHDGPWLHFDVFDNRQVNIARWDYMYKDEEGVYRGDYKIAGRKTANSVYIVDAESTLFLDSNTRQCFQSPEVFTSFLSDNHFATGSNYLEEGGLILPLITDDPNLSMDLLPKGLDLFQFNNCAGMCRIELIDVGTVLDSQMLSFSQWSWEGEKEISAKDYSLKFPQIDFEVYGLRYSYLYDENFVCIKSDNGSSLFLSISQLKSMGYYLENDSYFHIHKSPQIAFYPAVEINIRAKPNANANILQTTDKTNNRYFKVIQANDGWLEIEYHTHTYEPCTKISIEKQPVIKGWIPMYLLSENSENSEQELTLYFDTLGCPEGC